MLLFSSSFFWRLKRSIWLFASMATARFESGLFRFMALLEGMENATLGSLISGMVASCLLVREECFCLETKLLSAFAL